MMSETTHLGNVQPLQTMKPLFLRNLCRRHHLLLLLRRHLLLISQILLRLSITRILRNPCHRHRCLLLLHHHQLSISQILLRLSISRILLRTPLRPFQLPCRSHVSLLIRTGLFITWEKWMSHVLIVGLFTGELRSCRSLPPTLLNLASAVAVESRKSQSSTTHHQSFSIFSRARRTCARSFVNAFATTTMHWR